MEKVIEISGLTKRYGTHIVVNNLDLSVTRGEIFGLLGPNGAGKSTTILMLLGLTEPDSGRVRVCGLDPVRQPIGVKKKVGYLPEDVGFYDDFSGLENLIYTARLNKIPGDEAVQRAEQLLGRVGLGGEIHKKSGKYSRGMRQRLGLADVLIKHPEVIILDEPTLGIDPSGVKEFLELIVKLSREDGLTVLFSSHQLQQVQQVCDRVGIFVDGKLLAEGDIDSLASQLFPAGHMTVEGGMVPLEVAGREPATDPASVENLRKKLEQVNGVVKVEVNKNHFLVESDRDIAADISRVVLDSGFGLNYLKRKIFGLDDIYYRYFQGGGNDHE
jgi:ABC-2 type transport system ATP-binding protein